jgi:hypothetical protein
MSVYVDSTQVGTVEVVTVEEGATLDLSRIIPLASLVLLVFLVIAIIKAFKVE